MNVYDAAKLEQSEEALKSYSQQIGKYIFCRAREDGATRLFIDNINPGINALNKDGWWDIFTVVDRSNPQKKGLYLCLIEDYHLDKQGFLISTVRPIKFISEEDLNSGNEFINLFRLADIFPDYSALEKVQGERFNLDHAYGVFAKEIEEYVRTLGLWKELEKPGMRSHIFAKMIVSRWVHYGLTIPEINKALQEKYPMEKLADDIREHFDHYQQTYPIFCSEIRRKNINRFNPEILIDFIVSESIKYDRMVKDGIITEITGDQLRQCELVREYYVKLHKEQKAKKTAAKKAKKEKGGTNS